MHLLTEKTVDPLACPPGRGECELLGGERGCYSSQGCVCGVLEGWFYSISYILFETSRSGWWINGKK